MGGGRGFQSTANNEDRHYSRNLMDALILSHFNNGNKTHASTRRTGLEVIDLRPFDAGPM